MTKLELQVLKQVADRLDKIYIPYVNLSVFEGDKLTVITQRAREANTERHKSESEISECKKLIEIILSDNQKP